MGVSRCFAVGLAGAFLLAVCALSAGCPGHVVDQNPDILKRIKGEHEKLPVELSKLLDVARCDFVDAGPLEKVERSLLAACTALSLDPWNAEANYLAARACTWLIEYGETPHCYDHPRGRYFKCECIDYGRAAVQAAPDNHHYKYQYAMDLALRIRHSSFAAARFRLSTLVEVLQDIIEIDSTLDQGGPLRMLGAIYLKAPPWPAGFGDEEMALELLEEAVQDFPNHPLNQLFYAEALMEDEEYVDAQRGLARARELMKPGDFGWRVEGWSKMADQVQEKLDKRTQ